MAIREINPAQIKKIKVLQRLAGLEDDDYRLLLWNLAGVKSCKDLKGPQVDLVIGHLERSAGQEQGPGVRGQGSGNLPRKATWRQLKEIRRLWELVSVLPEADREQGLRRFLANRFGVAAPEWLLLGQASRVIEGLKAMETRRRPIFQGPGARDQIGEK